MDKNDFKQRLLRIAQSEAHDSGYFFTTEVDSQITDLINSGVNRMSLNDLENENHRRVAEENIRKFVRYMMNKNSNKQFNEFLVNKDRIRQFSIGIDMRAFSDVHLRICPLWPFC